LITDATGNLYGTTYFGGYVDLNCLDYQVGCGTVFELSSTPDGWRETVLYKFCLLNFCPDGAFPNGSLIFDQLGNLYGTTSSEGPGGNGVVFELSPSDDGTWIESVLYGFAGGVDGGWPVGNLTLDSAGNLYGTAELQGPYRNGLVFELISSAGIWSEKVLYAFAGGSDDGSPRGGVIFDPQGNLYGTAENKFLSSVPTRTGHGPRPQLETQTCPWAV
jgi:uncharacterized repeat protein (TIGR03803 family)